MSKESCGFYTIIRFTLYSHWFQSHTTGYFCQVLGVIACNDHYEWSELKSSMPMGFSTQGSGYINKQLNVIDCCACF